ncbi:hypothetical protein Pint_11742 [Pistacia integerrima]|uniref:Uncharacterized protein n=1 Tax=Pistacia integerrima TaxID=434235 RepID=A0ACC0XI94_9ROSI|nr:hypothetical protein Pint_11742 [Pistacia integerrima]
MADSISESVLEDYYNPNYILAAGSEATNASHIPACPVIVFVNSRSGGQLGGELLVSYRSLLNENQVFDLGEKAPDKVLHELYANLKKLRHAGDVAAGDGTAGWLLGVANRIYFEFQKGVADHTFMRIDGEPWKQPLPMDDDTVVVEISHLGQVSMLVVPGVAGPRSKNDLSQVSRDEETDSVEDEYDEDGEEQRKFGAADTFKIPDKVDIAHLS